MKALFLKEQELFLDVICEIAVSGAVRPCFWKKPFLVAHFLLSLYLSYSYRFYVEVVSYLCIGSSCQGRVYY